MLEDILNEFLFHMQKKLGDSIFAIGSRQANRNKWLEMGKSQVSRKVNIILYMLLNLFVLDVIETNSSLLLILMM